MRISVLRRPDDTRFRDRERLVVIPVAYTAEPPLELRQQRQQVRVGLRSSSAATNS